MLEKKLVFVGSIFLFLVLRNVDFVGGCNEAVCASIVSKCTLTQSCKCEMKNCTCCKECFDCLSYLYSECCSCVGTNPYFLFFCLTIVSIGIRTRLVCDLADIVGRITLVRLGLVE